MGAQKEEYEKYAPKHSFIHVDSFDSPKHLAKFLHELDKNDTEYNKYFDYKGTGEVWSEPRDYFCELCARLHNYTALEEPDWYEDINHWWRKTGTCVRGSWKNPKPINSSNR